MAAAKKKMGTRQSEIKKKKFDNAQKEKKKRILKRVGIACAAIIISGWATAWFILSDGHTVTSNWVKENTLKLTADAGFEIEKILVEVELKNRRSN